MATREKKLRGKLPQLGNNCPNFQLGKYADCGKDQITHFNSIDILLNTYYVSGIVLSPEDMGRVGETIPPVRGLTSYQERYLFERHMYEAHTCMCMRHIHV